MNIQIKTKMLHLNTDCIQNGEIYISESLQKQISLCTFACGLEIERGC